MRINSEYFIYTLKYFIGFIFIFSAISKLFPIEVFEFAIVKQGITGWIYVPYISRFVIGLEFGLGLAFLQNNYIRKIISPLAILLLGIFSIHLIMIMITDKNISNCGCFGEILPMSPFQAVLKNIIFILLLAVIIKNYSFDKLNKIIPIIIILLPIVLIFFIFPVKKYNVPKNDFNIKYDNHSIREVPQVETIKKPDTPNQKADTIKKEISYQEKYPKTKSAFAEFNDFNSKIIDLDDGVKVVALFSLTCEDCMAKAKLLAEYSKNKTIPLYILFWGEKEEVEPFFNFAGKIFPYQIIDAQKFFPLIKNSPPRICLQFNGHTIKEWGEKTFTIKDFNTQINKLKTHEK